MSGKLKAILLMAVMFGLGVGSGIAWQTYQFRRMPHSHTMFAERRIKHMVSDLKLSAAQEQSLRAIFEKANERATQVNEEVSWDLADIHRDSVQAIRKILTPEQVKEFEAMHKKFHEHHKHMPVDSDDDAPPPPPDAHS